MKTCIFCPTALTSETKPEHIWPNALGGRATTRGVICSECNNTFGSTIDAALASQVQDLRTLLNLSSGDKRTPPPLQEIIDKNQKFFVWPDGRIELRQKPFTIVKRDDGGFDVTIKAKDSEHVDNLIPHVAAAIGISEENLRTQLGRANAREIIQPSPQITRNIAFGGHDPLRSLAKSCLILWNRSGQDSAIKESPFDAVKVFVTNGDKTFLSNKIKLDGRPIPGADILANKFGPIFNLIFIKSDRNGKILAYVGNYNTAYWRIVIADSGGMPNRSVGLVSNPLNPNNWSYLPDFGFDLDISWLETPVIDESSRNPGDSIGTALKDHTEKQREQHIHEMLIDTFRECQISEGSVITEEAIARFSRRFAQWLLRIKTDRPLSNEEINSLISLNKG
ncbi:HNH endonuclease [Acidiphilium sp.]|uniref:HNH endonuclease n=1 Tax=Acidiphilium sp. TaxID=527 RepID=UPI0025854D30|nr:HNH endonuclease [Acidiphilium sp.]